MGVYREQRRNGRSEEQLTFMRGAKLPMMSDASFWLSIQCEWYVNGVNSHFVLYPFIPTSIYPSKQNWTQHFLYWIASLSRVVEPVRHGRHRVPQIYGMLLNNWPHIFIELLSLSPFTFNVVILPKWTCESIIPHAFAQFHSDGLALPFRGRRQGYP